jgi:hypothetical protein
MRYNKIRLALIEDSSGIPVRFVQKFSSFAVFLKKGQTLTKRATLFT